MKKISEESYKSLILPDQYISYLESTYKYILVDIETKHLSLLVIEKQKKYLYYLFKNGEININIYSKLLNILDNKKI